MQERGARASARIEPAEGRVRVGRRPCGRLERPGGEGGCRLVVTGTLEARQRGVPVAPLQEKLRGGDSEVRRRIRAAGLGERGERCLGPSGDSRVDLEDAAYDLRVTGRVVERDEVARSRVVQIPANERVIGPMEHHGDLLGDDGLVGRRHGRFVAPCLKYPRHAVGAEHRPAHALRGGRAGAGLRHEHLGEGAGRIAQDEDRSRPIGDATEQRFDARDRDGGGRSRKVGAAGIGDNQGEIVALRDEVNVEGHDGHGRGAFEVGLRHRGHADRCAGAPDTDPHFRRPRTDDAAESRRAPALRGGPRDLHLDLAQLAQAVAEPRDASRDIDWEPHRGQARSELRYARAAYAHGLGELEPQAVAADCKAELHAGRDRARRFPERTWTGRGRRRRPRGPLGAARPRRSGRGMFREAHREPPTGYQERALRGDFPPIGQLDRRGSACDKSSGPMIGGASFGHLEGR